MSTPIMPQDSLAKTLKGRKVSKHQRQTGKERKEPSSSRKKMKENSASKASQSMKKAIKSVKKKEPLPHAVTRLEDFQIFKLNN
jgi:uncharacterized protein YaiI (UPF0178 family)